MIDLLGTELNVGDTVVHAVMYGNSPRLQVKTIRKIENDKIYLGNSNAAIRYPSRLVILKRVADGDL